MYTKDAEYIGHNTSLDPRAPPTTVQLNHLPANLLQNQGESEVTLILSAPSVENNLEKTNNRNLGSILFSVISNHVLCIEEVVH